MNFRKIGVIARREYTVNVRRRSFLFAVFVVPLIVMGALALVFSLLRQQLEDVSAYTSVGVIDDAKIFTDAPLPAPFLIMENTDEATTALQQGKIQGYYVVPAEFYRQGQLSAYTRRDLPFNDGLNAQFNDAIKAALAAQLGRPELATRAADPLAKVKIFRVGSDQQVDENALFGSFLIPFIFVMVIFTSSLSTAQFLLSGMVEEKENRMMELFITSARPTEMLWGKLIGLGALGLTQLAVWGGLAVTVGIAQGTVNFAQILATYQITPGYLLLLVAYFFLSYVTFGTIMASLGALVNAEQEGRQISSFVSLLGIAPVFFIAQFLQNSNGDLPRFLSLLPFTAPTAMILRTAWGTVPPAEIALSLGLGLLMIVVLLSLAGRLMRLGMLNYGKKLSLGEIIRSIRTGGQLISSRDAQDPSA